MIGGLGELVGGTAIGLGGAATGNPIAVGAGLLTQADAAINILDGMTTVDNAIDGGNRRSTFGRIGYFVGGESGAHYGEIIGIELSFSSFSRAAAEAAHSGSMVDIFEATTAAGEISQNGASEPDCDCN
jgi:hypothetical protein